MYHYYIKHHVLIKNKFSNIVFYIYISLVNSSEHALIVKRLH